MKKTFTRFLTALALFAFFIPSLTVMGGTKTEGFESATTSSTYNQTVTVNANESDCGIGWTIYYGTVSTQGPINGQSAQMRWYKSAPTNYPYIQSTTAINNLTNVAFKARVGHVDVKMNVHYSSDGNNWTALATDVFMRRRRSVLRTVKTRSPGSMRSIIETVTSQENFEPSLLRPFASIIM